MGIRETLNENPRLTTGITIGIIALVLLVIVYQMFGSSGPSGAGGVTGGGSKLYFSDDDGKTYFADDRNKVPPFDHSGKEACRAHVVKCDGKTFVNYIERFSPEAKKRMEAVNAKGPNLDPTVIEEIRYSGLEVKKPGETTWIKMSDPKFTQTIRPKCADPNSAEELNPS